MITFFGKYITREDIQVFPEAIAIGYSSSQNQMITFFGTVNT